MPSTWFSPEYDIMSHLIKKPPESVIPGGFCSNKMSYFSCTEQPLFGRRCCKIKVVACSGGRQFYQ